MKIRNLFAVIILSGVIFYDAAAQILSNPFDFPMQLSGSFCDLRANHFHAGIDIRTKGAEGQPLHAVAGGYISRISVSPWGYGNAVYITHPYLNLITVYGHMQRFTLRLTDIVKGHQYEKESFAVDITFSPDELPVKQGDLIGYSGNSGSSGGPHLHLEVRDGATNEPTDGLMYYKSQITDTEKPLVRGIMIYPFEGRGSVNGDSCKQKLSFKFDNNKNPVIDKPIEAWGEIGLAIRAVDRMNGTGFSYGIKDVLQTVDGVETFHYTADRFSFGESNLINSFIDYEEWRKNGVFYMKTFVEPGNKLRMLASRNSGKIIIDEERIYNVAITLKDIYGNTCEIPIKIIGKKQDIAPLDTANTTLLRWYEYNVFDAKGVQLSIPGNNLYSSVYMQYKSLKSPKYYSDIHVLHNSPVPLHNSARLSIHMYSANLADSVNQFGIVKVTNRGRSWIGGKYRDGWVDADITELGSYAVARDVTRPTITPIDPANWKKNRQIRIKIKDDLSGIATFRGEIDGKYALFEYDAKRALLTYTYDDERLFPGYHKLKLTVVDGCGNTETFTHSFTW